MNSNPVFESILNQMHTDSVDITSSAIVATDGIPLCFVLRRDDNPDRVGGMSAAMLALSNRAIHEMVGGKMKQTIIEGDDGIILLVQASDNSVLVITARRDAKLGMVLVHARQAAKKIRMHSH